MSSVFSSGDVSCDTLSQCSSNTAALVPRPPWQAGGGWRRRCVVVGYFECFRGKSVVDDIPARLAVLFCLDYWFCRSQKSEACVLLPLFAGAVGCSCASEATRRFYCSFLQRLTSPFQHDFASNCDQCARRLHAYWLACYNDDEEQRYGGARGRSGANHSSNGGVCTPRVGEGTVE